MPIESPVNSIQDLNENYPLGTDLRNTLDDHIRLVKRAVRSLLTNPTQVPGIPQQGTEQDQLLRWNGSLWVPVRDVRTFQPMATNFTASPLKRYRITTGSVTVTLPASPQDGDWVELMVHVAGVVVNRNGKTIMGLAENMTIDVAPLWVRLVYMSASGDWRIAS
jgi:hypothetical protein